MELCELIKYDDVSMLILCANTRIFIFSHDTVT
jgi:hypothetical protein